MSVGIAQPTWNDDWKHAGDRTEPPETTDDERTCGGCYNFEPCPDMSCRWGICRAELGRWDGGNLDAFVRDESVADGCEDWEEA